MRREVLIARQYCHEISARNYTHIDKRYWTIPSGMGDVQKDVIDTHHSFVFWFSPIISKKLFFDFRQKRSWNIPLNKVHRGMPYQGYGNLGSKLCDRVKKGIPGFSSSILFTFPVVFFSLISILSSSSFFFPIVCSYLAAFGILSWASWNIRARIPGKGFWKISNLYIHIYRVSH